MIRAAPARASQSGSGIFNITPPASVVAVVRMRRTQDTRTPPRATSATIDGDACRSAETRYPPSATGLRRRLLRLACRASTPPSWRLPATLGGLLAERGITLVYGGGRVGLMGAVADGALAAGGAVIGVIPQSLVDRELAHRAVRTCGSRGSMHERKALMASLADGFVALPGGAGTLDELFEAWTWTMLGIHLKPCAVLDVGGFYAGLRAHVARMTSEGFIRPEHTQGLLFGADARRAAGCDGALAGAGAEVD